MPHRYNDSEFDEATGALIGGAGNDILSGGAGTRLWPLSREGYPKQFWPLVGEGKERLPMARSRGTKAVQLDGRGQQRVARAIGSVEAADLRHRPVARISELIARVLEVLAQFGHARLMIGQLPGSAQVRQVLPQCHRHSRSARSAARAAART